MEQINHYLFKINISFHKMPTSRNQSGTLLLMAATVPIQFSK
ncbi:hypothetical protein GGC63_000204 [Paenibacillus sp. OAS669]|nr:hypothetical protein [Paenibacillus sp. OAS669]